jgi:hypothetical protein
LKIFRFTHKTSIATALPKTINRIQVADLKEAGIIYQKGTKKFQFHISDHEITSQQRFDKKNYFHNSLNVIVAQCGQK